MWDGGVTGSGKVRNVGVGVGVGEGMVGVRKNEGGV